MTIKTVAELFEKSAALAADRLRELWGAERFQRMVDDPKASTFIVLDIKERNFSVTVRWQSELGDGMQSVVVFKIPAAEVA